jgi:hypothetical protein
MMPRSQKKSYTKKIFLEEQFVSICQLPRTNYHPHEEEMIEVVVEVDLVDLHVDLAVMYAILGEEVNAIVAVIAVLITLKVMVMIAEEVDTPTIVVVVVATETIEEIVTMIGVEAAIATMTDVAVVVDETAVVTETMIVVIDREVEIEEDEEIGISNVWNLNAEIATLLLETIHSCIQFYPSLI